MIVSLSSSLAIRVLDWKLLSPEMPEVYHVQKFAQQCSLVLDQGLYKHDTDLYVIERQSWRTLGPRGVPHAILRSTAFEALLIGMVMERGKAKNICVESIQPMSVAVEMGYDLVDSSVKGKYKGKKDYAVKKAQELINSKSVQCPVHYMNYFQNAKKQDDLSDSLLLGVAYANWIIKGHNYLNKHKFL
jgi:hypothetical protein